MPKGPVPGVRLSPLQTKIYNAVKKTPGISANAISVICLKGDAPGFVVRQHVHQINARLAETDLMIAGNLVGMRGYYRIVTRKQKKAWSNYEKHQGWKDRSRRPRRLVLP
jgi:hypothetical protein